MNAAAIEKIAEKMSIKIANFPSKQMGEENFSESYENK